MVPSPIEPGVAPVPAATGERITLVATFDTAEQARAVHAQAAVAAGTLFGRTVLVAVPGGDPRVEGLTDDLRAGGGDVIVDDDEHAVELTVACTASAPEAATALREEAREFFRLRTSMYLVPPWAAPDPRSDAARAAHRRARQTYLAIEDAGDGGYDDPAVTPLLDQLEDAALSDNQARTEQISEEIDRIIEPFRQRDLERLRSGADPGIDAVLVERYLAIRAGLDPDAAVAVAARELAPQLGQLVEASTPAPEALRHFASYGYAATAGAQLRVSDLRFADLLAGPGALAAWLEANGCGEIRYRFSSADVW